jgi:hypothetical protein
LEVPKFTVHTMACVLTPVLLLIGFYMGVEGCDILVQLYKEIDNEVEVVIC